MSTASSASGNNFTPAFTIMLHVDQGTLWATPNAGRVRAQLGSGVLWTATFPFSIDFVALTGGPGLPSGTATMNPATGLYQFLFQDPPAPEGNASAPAYEYTIRGDGEASGLVLDPIIIVDKRN